MGSLTLTISYAKNTGLVFNSTELKNLYFTGIRIVDQFGNPVPDDTIDFYINAAQTEIENELSIKLDRQAYKETRDFIYDDYKHYNFLNTTYPAVKAIKVQGYLNTSLQIDFPQEWITTKNASSEDSYWRSISFVPVSGPSTTSTGVGVWVGITPYLSSFTGQNIPNYWNIIYHTGFLKVPADILNIIGKTAAINLFESLGDLITGIPGVNSKSIGIDGLSQSVNTMRGFSMRIESYRKDIENNYPKLRNKYLGFAFGML